MFKAENLAALGIDAGHDMFNGAILARGIHGLKNQQQRVTVGSIEDILQIAHLFDTLAQKFFEKFF